MIKIIDNQKLELHYKEGFGSWTYHLKFPGTADIKGRWGHLKVSGTIDDFEVKNIYLAPRKDEDKIISINNLDSQKIITWSGAQHLRCYIIATASS